MMSMSEKLNVEEIWAQLYKQGDYYVDGSYSFCCGLSIFLFEINRR